jgi:hypothetical protein
MHSLPNTLKSYLNGHFINSGITAPQLNRHDLCQSLSAMIGSCARPYVQLTDKYLTLLIILYSYRSLPCNWRLILWWFQGLVGLKLIPAIKEMLGSMHPVHTAPSTALLWLGCYWPCRHPLSFRVGLHAEARWPIISHDQARNIQYDSRPVRHLSLAPNSSILNKLRLLPLIHVTLAGVPTIDFLDTPDL